MHACDLASLKGGVHTRRGRGLAEWVLDMRGVGLVRTTSILRSSAPRAPGIGIQKRREPRRNEGALRRSLDTESKIRWCLVGIVCESRVNALPYPFGSNDQYSAETYMLRITVSLRMRNTQTADRTLFSSGSAAVGAGRPRRRVAAPGGSCTTDVVSHPRFIGGVLFATFAVSRMQRNPSIMHP